MVLRLRGVASTESLKSLQEFVDEDDNVKGRLFMYTDFDEACEKVLQLSRASR